MVRSISCNSCASVYGVVLPRGGRLFNDDEFQPLRNELETIARELSAENIEQVVYAWILRLPSKPLPIIGSGKIERVRSAGG